MEKHRVANAKTERSVLSIRSTHRGLSSFSRASDFQSEGDRGRAGSPLQSEEDRARAFVFRSNLSLGVLHSLRTCAIEERRHAQGREQTLSWSRG